MPNAERGFTPLMVLIIATIGLVVIAGGTYLFRDTKIKDLPPQIIPRKVPDKTPEASPKLDNKTPSLKITMVSQPPCTAASCAATTVLSISGSGFSANSQLTVTGQNGSPYLGILSQVSEGGNVVYFDLLNLPCQTYNAVLTNPVSGSANFTFYPANC